MLTKQQLANKIIKIVEQVLGRKLKYEVALHKLATVSDPVEVDELQLIKYGIRNYDLITQQAIQRQIKYQITQTKAINSIGFKVRPPSTELAIMDLATRWQQYRDKLANILAQVEHRTAHNYSFNTRLPSQKQLLELEEECKQLTGQWYGAERANINLMYLFFVQMCLAAKVVRYDYYKINKYVSSDQYVVSRDIEQVRVFSQRYKQNVYQPFIDQGGCWAHGRSEIDATTISNIFYYKNARQLLCLEFAKSIIINEFKLEDYGQFLAEGKNKLWRLITDKIEAITRIDKDSIFYKFANFINTNPGEYFNYFAAELPEAKNIPAFQLYEVIKFCGLQCGKLNIISRTITEDWMPKRYLSLTLQRKYPLLNIDEHGKEHTLRQAKTFEHIRIWPNEMPYYPEHGLGLCGDGLVEGIENYGSLQYEWNTPRDPGAEFDNTARDIEVIFRQLQQLSPACGTKDLLPGEKVLSVYQSSISYSSIPETSHTHINRSGIDRFLIYQLPAYASLTPKDVAANVEFVQVGSFRDAIYLRVKFAQLLDEKVIVFLQQLHLSLLKSYGGTKHLDVSMRLFQELDGSGIFIYEPHARLVALENNYFLNPGSSKISKIRPQWSIPEGGEWLDFTNEQSGGLDYARDLFDQICIADIQSRIVDFVTNYSTTHQ